MAVPASYEQYRDGMAYLDLYVDEHRLWVRDEPDIPGYDYTYSVLFFFDHDKLDDGVREFLGLTILYIERLDDEDLRAIDALNPPRINVEELSLYDVTVTDVLRRARDGEFAPADSKVTPS